MYKIALLSVPFDNSYNDNMALSESEQVAQFKLGEIFDNSPLYNFKIGNAMRTTITIRAEKIVPYAYNYNYLIILNVDNNTYLYYFITNITFDTGNQLIIDLELDIMQSYYNKLEFGLAYVERAHIDRFVNNNDGTYRFNNSVDSPLYIEEKGDILKRVEKITPINIGFKNINQDVQNWLDRNIDFWEIYIIEGSQTVDIPVINGGKAPYLPIVFTNDVAIELGMYVIPHFKGDYKLLIEYNNQKYIPTDRLVTNNILSTAKIVSHVVTPICPLNPNFFKSPAPVNTDYVINVSSPYVNSQYFLTDDRNVLLPYNSVFLVSNTWETHRSTNNIFDVIHSPEIDISRLSLNDIRTYSNSEVLNPKLLLSNVYEISITDGYNEKKYIPLALSDSLSRKCEVITAFSPDIVSLFIYPQATTDIFGSGLYDINGYYEGLNSAQDGQILFNRSQLDVYLANNKNFLAQALTSNATALSSAGIAFGVKGHLAGMVGTAGNLANTFLQYDNIANSPDSVSGSKTNTLQNVGITSLKPLCKHIRCIDYLRLQINRYTNLYGYSYNTYDYISTLVNRRNSYVYIKAQLTTILNKSNAQGVPTFVRDKMREIFNKGIRLWMYIDQIGDFSIPNYELYL